MITAAGFWENRDRIFSTCRSKLELWTYSIKPFGVSRLVLVDTFKEVPDCLDKTITFELRDTLDEILDEHDGPIVFLSQPGLVPAGVECCDLVQFQHPAGDVLYIAGSDYRGLDLAELAEAGRLTGNHVVSIATATDVPLWAHVALAIAFRDRQLKQR